MAGKKKPSAKSEKHPSKRPIEQYGHKSKRRVNNPPVGLVTPDTDPVVPSRKSYDYDPHLDPQLVWAGKKEHASFDVPTVSLHVHERIDPATIIEAVRKRNGASLKPAQGYLFETKEENPPLREAVDFYRHSHGWTNRLIAGDSLLVMNSLIEKEGMAGQVQMVYIDPPYGIRYGSNFQPFVNRREVKDGKDEDLTQEPETIRAFRDTWELGSDAEKELIESTSAAVEKVLAEVRGANTNLSNASDTIDWATSTNNAIETALSNMVSSSDTYKNFQKSQAALVEWRVTLVDTQNELSAYKNDRLHNPDPFSTSFEAGCDYTFSTTKQNTLTLTLIDNLPDKSAAAPSTVLSVVVECASPFNVSAGVEFSTVPSRQFAIQPVATPPGSTTTTNQFVLTSNSGFHPLPLVMVSARLCEPNEKVALNMSFGISGNFSSQNGSSAEFLIGPSLSLFRAMYFTPGLHIGKQTNLGSGFSVGDPAPPNVTTPPLRSSYAAGFGFAITFTKP